jgi:hypothetical protein
LCITANLTADVAEGSEMVQHERVDRIEALYRNEWPGSAKRRPSAPSIGPRRKRDERRCASAISGNLGVGETLERRREHGMSAVALSIAAESSRARMKPTAAGFTVLQSCPMGCRLGSSAGA